MVRFAAGSGLQASLDACKVFCVFRVGLAAARCASSSQFNAEQLGNGGIIVAREVRPMQLSDSISEIIKQKGGAVCSVAPSNSVYDAIAMMAEKQVGALLVLSENKLVGIVSERDYARKVILKGHSSKETKVLEIMSSPVIAVSPEHTVVECMKIITDHHIRHLPVLDRERIVGVISIRDLVNWILSAQSETIRHLEAYITGTPT
jgi:CBS domain-containing protein